MLDKAAEIVSLTSSDSVLGTNPGGRATGGTPGTNGTLGKIIKAG